MSGYSWTYGIGLSLEGCDSPDQSYSMTLLEDWDGNRQHDMTDSSICRLLLTVPDRIVATSDDSHGASP